MRVGQGLTYSCINKRVSVGKLIQRIVRVGEVRLSHSPIPKGLKRVQDLDKPNQSSYWYGNVCTLVKNSTRGRKVSLDVHRVHLTTAAYSEMDRMRKWTSTGNGA